MENEYESLNHPIYFHNTKKLTIAFLGRILQVRSLQSYLDAFIFLNLLEIETFGKENVHYFPESSSVSDLF